ncbi:MAG: hypothetical protein ACRDAX_04635 [Propionibacteriaceae bacterium]
MKKADFAFPRAPLHSFTLGRRRFSPERGKLFIRPSNGEIISPGVCHFDLRLVKRVKNIKAMICAARSAFIVSISSKKSAIKEAAGERKVIAFRSH